HHPAAALVPADTPPTPPPIHRRWSTSRSRAGVLESAAIRDRSGPRRVRGLGGRWAPAELDSHAEVVAVGPVLGHLAVLDAEPVALGDREPPAGRWEGRLHGAVRPVADEGPGLATTHGGVDGDEIAVVGDVVDLPGQIRER